MKAFLLAAGKGTRLRPLTDTVPKCLVPVRGTPMLDIWFRLLRAHGVTDVLVNTHHLADRVERHVAAHPVPGLAVTLVHEPVLLGSAGTVAANRSFVEGEPDFLILYADNLTDMDLGAFVRFHRQHKSPFTIGLFETPTPTQCGIAKLAPDGRVIGFEEKPAQPQGNLANAGIYMAGPSLFARIPQKPVADFGYDVLPFWTGIMYGYRIREFFCDIGTPERLRDAERRWPAAPSEDGQC